MQIWVPDVRDPGFAAEAHRQSALAAASPQATEDQEFVNAISWSGNDSDEMRRGELWTADGGKHYAGEPVLVVQDDRFDATDSVTICPLTTDATGIPLLRIPLGTGLGLDRPSSLMVDKLTTMTRAKLGERIGAVSDTEMLALSRSLVVFLGLA